MKSKKIPAVSSPSGPGDEEQLESYEDVYHFQPPKMSPGK